MDAESSMTREYVTYGRHRYKTIFPGCGIDCVNSLVKQYESKLKFSDMEEVTSSNYSLQQKNREEELRKIQLRVERYKQGLLKLSELTK